MGRLIGKVKFEKMIKGMLPGEEGYTMPWALSFDEKGEAWLNVRFPVYSSKRGSARLRIVKIGLKRNEYDIFVGEIDYKWSVGSEYDKIFAEEKIDVGTVFSSEKKRLVYQNSKKTD